MPLDTPAYLSALRLEGRLLLDAAHGALDRPVPACPDWTVASVVGHVGRVYRSVIAHVVSRATAPVPASEIPQPPEGVEILPWFEEAHTAVIVALGSIGPTESVWTWADDKTAGFYHRRMANETLVHRLDVEQAVGRSSPIDPDQAADAIPELYELILPFAQARRPRDLPAGSLHLHRTDGPGEWMIAAVDGRIVLTEEHGKGDAAVRGPAADLVRFAWNRGRPDALTVFGDEAVAAAWAELAP